MLSQNGVKRDETAAQWEVSWVKVFLAISAGGENVSPEALAGLEQVID